MVEVEANKASAEEITFKFIQGKNRMNTDICKLLDEVQCISSLSMNSER